MKTAKITSAVPLTQNEIANLKSALKLTAADQCYFSVDKECIGGLAVEINGVAIDLTIKHQLSQIAQDHE